MNLAKKMVDLRINELKTHQYNFIPFTPDRRISGVDILDADGKTVKTLRKGAVDTILAHVMKLGGNISPELEQLVQSIARRGGTPLLVSLTIKLWVSSIYAIS